MGLKKSKELRTGATGEYWVAEAKNNMVVGNTGVLMLLFKDKAARDEGKMFLERVSVDNVAGTYLNGEQVYDAVKISKLDDQGVETNWFADAEDILE
jgi:hypothetical protein